jgi:hypothetical protein
MLITFAASQALQYTEAANYLLAKSGSPESPELSIHNLQSYKLKFF